jgi:hypothetical protein
MRRFLVDADDGFALEWGDSDGSSGGSLRLGDEGDSVAVGSRDDILLEYYFDKQ